MKKTIAFTGHRPNKLGNYNEDCPVVKNVKTFLRCAVEQAVQNGYERFFSGMALGVDTWGAEAVIKVREKHPIKLVAVVPFEAQSSIWPQHAKDRWYSILKQADEIYVVSENKYMPLEELNLEHNKSCVAAMWLNKRNEWMVDHTDSMIAVWDGTSGGTGNCVKYAKKVGKKVFHYNPDTNETNTIEAKYNHDGISEF